MIGEHWETTRRNRAILAQPKGPTVCSCGAPGGSAHNHNTGEVVVQMEGGRTILVAFADPPDFGCSWCVMGVHGNCSKPGCTCRARDHRAG